LRLRRNETAENKLGLQLLKNIARDQRYIWTSPAHVRLGMPIGSCRSRSYSRADGHGSRHEPAPFKQSSTLRNYRKLSNYGAAGMAAAVGGLYLWGHATNDPHKQEAGI